MCWLSASRKDPAKFNLKVKMRMSLVASTETQNFGPRFAVVCMIMDLFGMAAHESGKASRCAHGERMCMHALFHVAYGRVVVDTIAIGGLLCDR